MENDIEHILSAFRNQASAIFVNVSESFENKAAAIDRNVDENVFQQLQSRYAVELKNRLDITAENLMDKFHGNKYTDLLRKELSNHISYNITAFKLKIRSM